MVEMYKKTKHLPPHSRVRLKLSVDPSIYGDFACVGNEGIIEAVRMDRFDLPEVYIRWDTNHWAHNGVNDCWTYAEHFELVEEPMASKNDKVQEILGAFAQSLEAILSDDTKKPTEEPSYASVLQNKFADAAQAVQQQQPAPEEDNYAKAIEAIAGKLHATEAFVVVAVERRKASSSPQGMLIPVAYEYTRTPEALVLVNSYMANAAARAYQDLAIQTIANADES